MGWTDGMAALEKKNEKRIICYCKRGFSKMSPPDVGRPLVMVSVAESARAAGGEITLVERKDARRVVWF